ncbi:UNKNOWN [Stylonychia lemnae]|uniref:Uncharacterized protein n=1 Tax=Stylonychia lemnae TaxID=5949 RepID=A0A078AFH4_STYLE|nr:UNKNOWN [Stylonychia lemnae]|eukprot:CDW80940.1 UNKNOWN [Stylonychia lemnae]
MKDNEEISPLSRRKPFSQWLQQSQKENQMKLMQGYKSYYQNYPKAYSRLSSPGFSRSGQTPTEVQNIDVFQRYQMLTTQKRAQSLAASSETPNFKHGESVNKSFGGGNNNSITLGGYQGGSQFGASVKYTESIDGSINPYTIKRAGPNAHQFKFHFEKSNFQRKSDYLMEKIESALEQDQQKRNFSTMNSHPINSSIEFKRMKEEKQQELLKKFRLRQQHQKSPQPDEIKVQIGLIKMKEVDVESEVKQELIKTIQAKQKLMVNNTISFRYDDLPGIGISKDQLMMLKRKTQDRELKDISKVVYEDSLRQSIRMYQQPNQYKQRRIDRV